MKKTKEFSKTVDIMFTTLLNLLWFGAWLYIIFILNNSGWWILIPLAFNFNTDEYLIQKMKYRKKEQEL